MLYSKSFFDRSNEVNLYEFYIPTGLKKDKEIFRSCGIADLFKENSAIIITGTGGSGKSMFVRHVFIDAVKCGIKLPVRIELRDINSASEQTVATQIRERLHDGGLDFKKDAILELLNAGEFLLLVDGFDELKEELREDISKELIELNRRTKNYILITSRADERLLGWDGFSERQMAGLSIDQIVEMVKKTPLDESTKKKFETDLRAKLYRSHREFVENPLLLCIMLLFYNDAADIPKKMSVFYEQAYEVLFQKHDSWKGAFVRQRRLSVDIHDFSRLFSSFSVMTYNDGVMGFNKLLALDYSKKAMKMVGIDAPAEHFLYDSIQSICLLVEDGGRITFVHRLFQEYFTAKYIANCESGLKLKLAKNFARKSGTDNVAQMLHELQPEYVEINLLLPHLEKETKKAGAISGKITFETCIALARLRFKYIELQKADDHKEAYPRAHPKSANISGMYNLMHHIGSKYGLFNIRAYIGGKDIKKIFQRLYENYDMLSSGGREVTTSNKLLQDMYDMNLGFMAKSYLEDIRTLFKKLSEKKNKYKQKNSSLFN